MACEAIRFEVPQEARRFGWIGLQPDAREGVLSVLGERGPEWTLSVERDTPELAG